MFTENFYDCHMTHEANATPMETNAMMVSICTCCNKINNRHLILIPWMVLRRNILITWSSDIDGCHNGVRCDIVLIPWSMLMVLGVISWSSDIGVGIDTMVNVNGVGCNIMVK